MNRRQRRKMIPSTWIIAIKQTEARKHYALFAIDWRRGGRLSWEGWNNLADLLQFHIPIKRKAGGTKSSSQPAAKIAKRALYLYLNEKQYGELERLFYQPFSKKQWRAFIKEHSNNNM
ncbi:hypothetical protein [Paenibacillus xylanivorans]|uniref:Uncharacterized protein n=1 Tax=Paenibacillus xylanivorans TaxID=1705561 RepID=A0A0N0C383_9BACL|nr:hypothetical protein [Paenibacillus xylanivorans]KOY13914.1 hypothetical protein AMS66_23740 [Paenibacillus xylanivorans]